MLECSRDFCIRLVIARKVLFQALEQYNMNTWRYTDLEFFAVAPQELQYIAQFIPSGSPRRDERDAVSH